MACVQGVLKSVDDLLLETIDDVLKQVFGKKPAKILIQGMKKNYFLEWEEIPSKVEVFADGLGKILGSGAVIIEDLILESLHSELGLELKWKKGYGFSDYIKELRNKCGLTVEG